MDLEDTSDLSIVKVAVQPKAGWYTEVVVQKRETEYGRLAKTRE